MSAGMYRKPLAVTLLLTGILTLMFTVLLTGRAHATVTPNPTPGTSGTSAIPAKYMNTSYPENIPNCDNAAWLAANRLNFFGTWLAPDGVPQNEINNFSANYGLATANLSYNMLMVNCHDAATVSGGVYLVDSMNHVKTGGVIPAGGTTTISPGDNFSVAVQNGHLKGGFNATNFPFQYSPAGGFTSDGWHTISIDFTTTASDSLGNYGCVNDLGQDISISNHFDDANCRIWHEDFTFYVNVTPPPGGPPVATITGVTCNTIWGTASDGEAPSGGLLVHINISGALDAEVYTDASGNWSWNVGAQFKDTNSRVIYVAVRGVDGGGTPNEWVQASNSGGISHGPCYAASCIGASIQNIAGTTYPNSRYKVSVTFRNTGSATWYSSDTGGASEAGQTNNYLNSSGTQYLNMTGSGTVAPGSDVTYESNEYMLPAHVVNNFDDGTYQSFWKLGNYSVPGAWFGPQCGLEFIVEQGRVGDAYDWSTWRSATINTCSMGNVDTGTNGWFTFVIPKGWGFCTYIASAPTAPDAIHVRPFDWYNTHGYRACIPNSVCTDGTSFYGSVNGAGVIVPDQVAGVSAGGVDRPIDYGYDLALSWKPVISCTISSTSAFEIGESFTPEVRVQNSPPAGSSGPITGTVNYSVDTAPVSNRSGSIAPPIPRGGFRLISLPPSVTPSVAKTHNASASVSWSDGLYSDTATCPSTMMMAGNKPYMKIYGGDVWAGGIFGSGACTAPAGSGGVAGWARSVDGNTYAGSSSQLTITSLLNVNNRGFYSAATRPGELFTGNTYQPKGLTFANISDTYGDDFSDGGRCFADYYEQTYDSSLFHDNDFNGGGIPDGRSAYRLSAGDKEFGNFEIRRNKQTAVYVDGDLYIDRNITYDNAAWTTRERIPFFAAIVRGNIYIDNDVTRLDGLYVAQPNGSGGGKIYTCYPVRPTRGPAYDGTNVYDNCQQQLTVNGGLVAEQIKFLRVRNSLRDAVPDEVPDFNTGAGTNAAEVINYIPAMYLADSPLRIPSLTNGNVNSGKYDAITGLPPIY